MVIGVCSFGYSGSGAVFDLLKEYEGVKIAPEREMSFLYRPDGLSDLEYHLETPCRFFSCDIAIKRFDNKIKHFFRTHPEVWNLKSYQIIYDLTDKYLNSLCDVVWEGWWTFDIENMDTFSFYLYRLLNKITTPFPTLNLKLQKKCYYRNMFLSVKPIDFIQKTREYMNSLFNILGFDLNNEKVVLDQVFPADNPTKYMRYFNSSKAIIVDKDPRDTYLMLKNESFRDCSWTPTENVGDFISYYHAMRRNYTDANHENVLLVKIEDMIYEYEKTIKLIEKFIGLTPEQHNRKFMYFNPSKSINNTQLFRKYPGMKDDIKKIEDSLPQYLFDYKNYPIMKHFGKAF